MAATDLNLKLLINKTTNKVIFAESGKDFVDFLFNLFSLPLGSVTTLLTDRTKLFCIGDLYESIKNMKVEYIQPNQSKDSILNPIAMDTKIQLSTSSGKLYRCKKDGLFVSYTPEDSRRCPECGSSTHIEVMKYAKRGASEGVYVQGISNYMVMDDLSVRPLTTLTLGWLKKLGTATETMEVQFGTDEALKLLQASLQSKTALNDVYIAKKEA